MFPPLPLSRRRTLKALGFAAAARVLPTSALQAAAVDSPDIFANQIGFRPGDAKRATVRGAAPDQRVLRVLRAVDGKPVLEVALSGPQMDAASGDRVQVADLSALREAGRYRLEIGGQGTGPFAVSEQAYADALRVAMRGYTGQRCGTAVDLGGGYQHPACHQSGAYGASTGRTGALPNLGGWHDAGDYGRYVVNSGITCGTLLWAWEMFPAVLRELQLNIPKHHGGLPDFLEEVRWNLGWMLQMQEQDGGVFHKQTSNQFCAFILPQDDHLTSNVIGTGSAPFKNTAATGDFAAVMAIAARCYEPFDRAFAQQCLQAAQRAWTWAVAHPEVPFRNPSGVSTGEYGDPHLADELLWASAELWRTTGEPAYEQAFLHGLPPDLAQLRVDTPSWGSVGSLALWTYVLATRKGDERVRSAIRESTHQAAEQLVSRCRGNGYGNTLALSDFGWGSNGTAGNQSLLLVVAHRFASSGEFAAAAMANLDYLLGRNCFGISWVTGLGTRPFLHPHHRPSAADGITDPWPGLLSGGPNAHGGDKVADRLPKAPPMRMWVDDQDAYSLNEIAINWNAPLVFLLAFANRSS